MQEAERYTKALTPGSYASIQVGVLGIGKQRDFILDHFGAGSHVVMVDDTHICGPAGFDFVTSAHHVA